MPKTSSLTFLPQIMNIKCSQYLQMLAGWVTIVIKHRTSWSTKWHFFFFLFQTFPSHLNLFLTAVLCVSSTGNCKPLSRLERGTGFEIRFMCCLQKQLFCLTPQRLPPAVHQVNQACSEDREECMTQVFIMYHVCLPSWAHMVPSHPGRGYVFSGSPAMLLLILKSLPWHHHPPGLQEVNASDHRHFVIRCS